MSTPRSLRHAGAFRLMRYRCERCGFVEIVWNSRDGLIPFAIECAALPSRRITVHRLLAGSLANARGEVFPASEALRLDERGVLRFASGGVHPAQPCGGRAIHTGYRGDERRRPDDEPFAPDHDPLPGERYFRDGTPAEARAIMRGRVETWDGSEPLAQEDIDEMMACCDGRALTSVANGFAPGWPQLVVRGTDADALPPADQRDPEEDRR